MQKIFLILSVALLALTACTSSDDNPAKPQPQPRTVLVGSHARIVNAANFGNLYHTGPAEFIKKVNN